MDNLSIIRQFLQEAWNLLDSSSESDSDGDDELLVEMYGAPLPLPKVKDFISETVENYNDDQFRENFRMKWATYETLEAQFLVSESLRRNHYGGSAMTPARTQLLSFLWFAANKTTIREVASRFDMAISTFERCFHRVLTFLNGIAGNVIKFPDSLEERRSITEEFSQINGFPNIIGCIDGTFIPIRTPINKVKSTYVNRHDFPSLTLQGICDANMKFLDVFTGIPSKIHDARVFQLSFISSNIKTICGEFHLLGDAAYPLKSYLLTPFRDYGNLSNEERFYNFKFAQSRVKIENTFGVLKQRWRQLTRLDCHQVLTCSNFITACCVLHNLCIDMNDVWEAEEFDIQDEDADLQEEDNAANADDNERLLGVRKRAEITAFLSRQ